MPLPDDLQAIKNATEDDASRAMLWGVKAYFKVGEGDQDAAYAMARIAAHHARRVQDVLFTWCSRNADGVSCVSGRNCPFHPEC